MIVAGGSGLRMKGPVRKQYLYLAGLPILSHTVMAFEQCPAVNRIFLVIPEADQEFCSREVLAPLNLQKPFRMIPGGLLRQDSVYNGLMAAKDQTDLVAIHDGVRPFVRPRQIADTLRAAHEFGACILGIPAFDTLKQAEGDTIRKTLDRQNIWLAQTPQSFRIGLILEAHETARAEGYTGTDDASLAERIGRPVRIIPGTRFNLKITTPEDLELARAIHAMSASR